MQKLLTELELLSIELFDLNGKGVDSDLVKLITHKVGVILESFNVIDIADHFNVHEYDVPNFLIVNVISRIKELTNDLEEYSHYVKMCKESDIMHEPFTKMMTNIYCSSTIMGFTIPF